MKKPSPSIQFSNIIDFEENGEMCSALDFPVNANLDNNIAAERLKLLRKEHLLSQETVASALNISRREYWRFEQPEYNGAIQRYVQLACYYNVSLDFIFGIRNEKRRLDESKVFFVNGSNAETDNAIISEFIEEETREERERQEIIEELLAEENQTTSDQDAD